MDRLDAVLGEITRFRDEREWAQFHTPKNLVAALTIETAELQELMLWKTDDEIEQLLSAPDGKSKCEAELADVLIFALLLCDRTQIDPIEAIRTKLKENAAKYPIALAKGNATKYSQFKPPKSQ